MGIDQARYQCLARELDALGWFQLRLCLAAWQDMRDLTTADSQAVLGEHLIFRYNRDNPLRMDQKINLLGHSFASYLFVKKVCRANPAMAAPGSAEHGMLKRKYAMPDKSMKKSVPNLCFGRGLRNTQQWATVASFLSGRLSNMVIPAQAGIQKPPEVSLSETECIQLNSL
jgi:hypothetical protein